MSEDLKLSQIGSSLLPPPFRGLHSPGVRKHCQIIFACYFRKPSNIHWLSLSPNLHVYSSLLSQCYLTASHSRIRLHFGTFWFFDVRDKILHSDWNVLIVDCLGVVAFIYWAVHNIMSHLLHAFWRLAFRPGKDRVSECVIRPEMTLCGWQDFSI